MPRPTKQTKNNNKTTVVDPEVVDSTQGPQLNDSAIGTPQWSSTMQKSKDTVDDIQSQSGEPNSPQTEQPGKQEKGLTTESDGGYFERKLLLFRDQMVGHQANWTNALERIDRIMAEDVADAVELGDVLQERQTERRKQWATDWNYIPKRLKNHG